jgi:hypothetical protein
MCRTRLSMRCWRGWWRYLSSSQEFYGCLEAYSYETRWRHDESDMGGLRVIGFAVAVAFALGVGCDIGRPPDLTASEAAKLISRASEFNRYARLITVERVNHLKDSMDSVSYGLFTFVQLDSPTTGATIKGWADFRYWDREWHLNEFDYGCDHSALDPEMRTADCHIVHCYNPPPK